MPALFTSVVSAPKVSFATLIAAFQLVSSVTSRRVKTACPPAFLISAATLFPSSVCTSPITTLAPSLANNFACAAPSPLAAPDISSIFPDSRFAIRLLLQPSPISSVTPILILSADFCAPRKLTFSSRAPHSSPPPPHSTRHPRYPLGSARYVLGQRHAQ